MVGTESATDDFRAFGALKLLVEYIDVDPILRENLPSSVLLPYACLFGIMSDACGPDAPLRLLSSAAIHVGVPGAGGGAPLVLQANFYSLHLKLRRPFGTSHSVTATRTNAVVSVRFKYSSEDGGAGGMMPVPARAAPPRCQAPLADATHGLRLLWF